ncbi:hypothetical protein RE428_08420 [Marinobacter nanhaiticus D15-8W]|uniref:Uncharacterized protein n=1 Tax=Marinobacter nanhaiticus D15-8W TaxID=626887 RepID=N6WSM1_9GAMM|nr:DUF6776 family protein [Marinobacter nanhaiticus]ENO14536.1 hypothetical protein J057_04276 [Marinobacter nanhaiticus D15-8W]BES69824.1 hypothetical protein RE428_08420 [Marinobacter nanhaiticus D15-8W]
MASGKEHRGEYVVVRHRPGRRIRRFLILLTFSVGAAVLGYMTGMAQGGFRFTDMAKTRSVLSSELSKLREQHTDLQQKMINLERGNRIDQQALKQARETISQLESKMVSLNSDLTFYKNIMAPSETATGLQIQRFELDKRRSDGTYAFKLVLTQVGDNRSYIAGFVAVNVIGEKGGERQVIALRDLSKDIEDLGVRFRYRYFQDVEGVMTLPADFTPLEIQVVAKAEGKKASRSERTFDWQLLLES